MLKFYLIWVPRTLLSLDILLFILLLDQRIKPLDFNLSVTIPLDCSLIANFVVKACIIHIGNREFLVNLILLEMQDFDVILGINWLATHHVTLDCFKKRVIFHLPR